MILCLAGAINPVDGVIKTIVISARLSSDAPIKPDGKTLIFTKAMGWWDDSGIFYLKVNLNLFKPSLVGYVNLG